MEQLGLKQMIYLQQDMVLLVLELQPLALIVEDGQLTTPFKTQQTNGMEQIGHSYRVL
jgi:hypothetical protein